MGEGKGRGEKMEENETNYEENNFPKQDENVQKGNEEALEDIRLRRRKREKRKKKNKLFTALLVFLVVFVSFFNIFFGFDRVKKNTIITIEKGSSTASIAQKLKHEGVISKKYKFILKTLISKNQDKLKYGDFELSKGMNYSELIKVLTTEGAKKETVKLVIPEGFSVENIKLRMQELGLGDEESIEQALNADYDYEFIEKIPQKEGQKYRLQGFLFPSTYEFYKDDEPYDVIDRILKEFDKQYKSVKSDYDNIYTIITKASMVEREARVDSERATIAGVFENRLKSNMKLQIDATVVYVASDGLYDVNRVLFSDLKTKSGYNTYYVEGLPTGPICNPGIESIKAALNPEKHSYLFYHTDEEKGEGSHIFTEDFQSHKQTMN